MQGPSVDFQSFGEKPLPITPQVEQFTQPFYKQLIKLSSKTFAHSIGLHIYDFSPNQEDFIQMALELFLSEAKTPATLHLFKPNHLYLQITIVLEDPKIQMQREIQLETQMCRFMMMFRKLLIRFFDQKLDMEQVISGKWTDELLLQEFKKDVIDGGNNIIWEMRTNPNQKKL